MSKTLLVFLAHPDDESFGSGGTLARYARAGVAVHYVCATRGESGTVDPARLNGYASVAELRSAELDCAGRELGLAGVHYLGYRDSGMAGQADNQLEGTLHQAPLDEAAERIVGFLTRLKPDAVLTHDQFGGYGHPDHIKLHLAVLRAYQLHYGVMIDVSRWHGDARAPTVSVTPAAAAAAPPLYFAVIPKTMIRMGVRILPLLRQNPRQFGRNKDIDLLKIAGWEVPVTTRIDINSVKAVKERASACHASQQPPSQGPWFVRMLFRLNQGREHLSRVYPPALAGAQENTLLGLD
jgi:LmbE family N-acetylglucosaminyl deacetylase